MIDTTDEERVSVPEPASHIVRRDRIRILVRNGLAVAVLLITIFTATLVWRGYLAMSAEHDTMAALEAAKTRTSTLLSYGAPTLDADLARAKQQVTGSLGQRFDQIAQSTIVPSARQDGIVTTATVVRAGVVDAEQDRVVVLVFVDQLTTKASQPQPTRQASQATVTMEKTNGTWLISEMSAV